MVVRSPAMRWPILVAALALVLTADVRQAKACQCDQVGPPCQDYFQSEVVFVGTVRSVTPNPGAALDARVRVEFQDAVPSRGMEGTSITVFTSDNDASCGYAFKPGERYVVYARRSKDGTRIHVSICSRTRPFAEGAEDIRFFDTLSTPSNGARVFGTINHWDSDLATGEFRDRGPVGGIELTLRGSGRSFQARSGGDGRYEITGVPTGRYELTALPPPPFSTAFLARRLELSDTRACHATNFGIRYDTRITGSITDSQGRPVMNAIVEATPAALVGKGLFREPHSTRTDATGQFEFTEVPAGRYVLGVNLAQGPDSGIVSPTRFHPDAADPANAIPFEVRVGERLQLARMTIPPMPPSYRITGTVTFQDGKPAAGASVSLSDGHERWKHVSAIIQTGRDSVTSHTARTPIHACRVAHGHWRRSPSLRMKRTSKRWN